MEIKARLYIDIITGVAGGGGGRSCFTIPYEAGAVPVRRNFPGWGEKAEVKATAALRIKRRGTGIGLSVNCELSVQWNMHIPLLSSYGLLLKRTQAELFSCLILRACCD